MAPLVSFDFANRLVYVDDPTTWRFQANPPGDSLDLKTVDDAHRVIAVDDPSAWGFRLHSDLVASLEAANDG